MNFIRLHAMKCKHDDVTHRRDDGSYSQKFSDVLLRTINTLIGKVNQLLLHGWSNLAGSLFLHHTDAVFISSTVSLVLRLKGYIWLSLMSLASLPTELLSLIAKNLSLIDVVKLLSCCQILHKRHAGSEFFWKSHYLAVCNFQNYIRCIHIFSEFLTLSYSILEHLEYLNLVVPFCGTLSTITESFFHYQVIMFYFTPASLGSLQ